MERSEMFGGCMKTAAERLSGKTYAVCRSWSGIADATRSAAAQFIGRQQSNGSTSTTSTTEIDEEAGTNTALMTAQEMHKALLKFAILILGLSSSAEYSLLSANLGRRTARTLLIFKLICVLLTVLQFCSIAMILLIFICCCRSRRLVTVLKVICVVTSLLFLVSAALALIVLLQTV